MSIFDTVPYTVGARPLGLKVWGQTTYAPSCLAPTPPRIVTIQSPGSIAPCGRAQGPYAMGEVNNYPRIIEMATYVGFST